MRRGDAQPIYVTCEICGGSKICGPHHFDGRAVSDWGLWACNSCRLTGDVPPVYESRVVEFLTTKGIAFRRNSNGFIIIPR
jgi:hypothetical protein